MTARVLHLLAATPSDRLDRTHALDAVAIAARATNPNPLIATVGPWPASPHTTLAIHAPATRPELAHRTIARHFAKRPLLAVHCWGLPAARLAALALPKLPRLFTPTDPLPPHTDPLARNALANARGLYLAPSEHHAWRHACPGPLLPPPSPPPSTINRNDVRQQLGLEHDERLILPLADVDTDTRRAAQTLIIAELALTDRYATILARYAPHARRARTLAARPAFTMRELPNTITLASALAAADTALAPTEFRTRQRVGSPGLTNILLRAAAHANLPTIVLENEDHAHALPPSLHHLFTPDPSPMGHLNRMRRHLDTAEHHTLARTHLEHWPRPAQDHAEFVAQALALYNQSSTSQTPQHPQPQDPALA